MRLRAQSKSSAEHNWLATCDTAGWAACATRDRAAAASLPGKGSDSLGTSLKLGVLRLTKPRSGAQGKAVEGHRSPRRWRVAR